jgi:hypothetical protein
LLLSFPIPLRILFARLRAEITPGRSDNASHHCTGHAAAAYSSAPVRMSWARLLKRVFDIDMEHCPHCSGNLKIIAAIEDPTVIAKILTHPSLSARVPPRMPNLRLGSADVAAVLSYLEARSSAPREQARKEPVPGR